MFVDFFLRQFRQLKVISSVNQKNHSSHLKGFKLILDPFYGPGHNFFICNFIKTKISIFLSLRNLPGGILNIIDSLKNLTTEVFKNQKVRDNSYSVLSGQWY